MNADTDVLGERVVFRDAATDTVGVPTDGSAAHLRAVLDEIDPHRGGVRSVANHTTTLDDVFLALTGHRTSPQVEKEAAHV